MLPNVVRLFVYIYSTLVQTDHTHAMNLASYAQQNQYLKRTRMRTGMCVLIWDRPPTLVHTPCYNVL
jgi:hypothetical protein